MLAGGIQWKRAANINCAQWDLLPYCGALLVELLDDFSGHVSDGAICAFGGQAAQLLDIGWRWQIMISQGHQDAKRRLQGGYVFHTTLLCWRFGSSTIANSTTTRPEDSNGYTEIMLSVCIRG